MSGGQYDSITSGQVYLSSRCVADSCYTLVVHDSFGDGLDKASGGGYSVSVDGTVAVTSSSSDDGFFAGAWMNHRFNCPSSAPVPETETMKRKRKADGS